MKKLLISLLLGLGLTSLIGCGTMNKKVTNSEQIEQTQDLSKYDKRQYNTVIFTEEDYEMDKRINKEMNKGMKDSNEALQKALEGQKQIEEVICK